MTKVIRGLAFGMTWYTSMSDTRDELKQQAKNCKANVYAEAIFESSRMYGFAEVKRWKNVRAAAAVIAETLPGGGVFVHRVEGELSCLIVVDPDRRLPVPGYDVIGTRTQIIALAKKYLDTNSRRALSVFGDVQSDEIEGAQPINFERVAKDAVVSGLLKPVNPLDERWIVAAMVVVGIATVWFSDKIISFVTPTPEKPVVSMEAQYRANVKETISRIEQLNQFPENVISGFQALTARVAFEAAGWKIEHMKCNDADCTVVWRRSEGATSEGLLRALNLSINDPNILFYDVDFAKSEMKMEKATNAKQLVLVPNGMFSARVGSWLQTVADRQTYKPSLSEKTLLVPLNGAKVAPSEIPQVGSYSFSVPFTAEEVKIVASLPEVMTIESIEVTRQVGNTMAVKFNGKYYVY